MNQIKRQIDKELSGLKAGRSVLDQARSKAPEAKDAARAKGEQHAAGQTGRKKRSRKLRVCAAAALVLIIGCVTVGASGIFGHFSDYFSGDLGAYHDRILQSARYTEDENFAVGIDGVVSDDMRCMFVYNVEALSDQARGVLRQALGKGNLHNFSEELQFRAIFEDGKKEDLQSFSVFEYMDFQSDCFQSYVVTADADDLEIADLQDLEAIEISFRGLTLEAQVDPMATFTLTADAESAAAGVEEEGDIVRDVRLSPLGFSFRSYSEDMDDICLIPRDKTVEDKSYGAGFTRDSSMGEIWYFGDFGFQILDLSQYCGLRIDGVNYYMDGAV